MNTSHAHLLNLRDASRIERTVVVAVTDAAYADRANASKWTAVRNQSARVQWLSGAMARYGGPAFVIGAKGPKS